MINTIFLILIIIIIFYTFNHYLKSKNLIKFEKFQIYSNYNPTQYYRDTTGNNILPIDNQYSVSFETFKNYSNYNPTQYYRDTTLNIPPLNLEYSLKENEYNLPFKNERIIWMYWETLPGKKKPGYIDLCINSIKFNCGNCFEIIVLDNKNILKYIPEIENIDFSNLNLPQKVDFYRYCLLEKYGGVWIDADILVIKCICPFFKKLENNDYVGFGCGHNMEICQQTLYGYSKPLNWFMISKKETPFIKCVKKTAYEKIEKANRENKKLPYHDIGKIVLKECYEKLNKDQEWSYAHISSKCQEFDTKGNKLNNIMIDFEWKDCENERIFFPLYNTAPGYPDWFKDLSEDELKNNESYLKPLIQQAFTIKDKCL